LDLFLLLFYSGGWMARLENEEMEEVDRFSIPNNMEINEFATTVPHSS
jgi:hypothetical protein